MSFFYVWTRRAGVWIAVVGAWESIRWLTGRDAGSSSDIMDLVFWSGTALMGWFIWYRLRNIEEDDEVAAPSTSPSG